MIKNDQDYSEYLPVHFIPKTQKRPPLKNTIPTSAKHHSGSSSYQPDPPEAKNIDPEETKKKFFAGSWSSWENYVYYRFMEDNYDQFLTERERRRCKVFFRLSKILKKRTPDQCRSHHQKLQIKFKDNLPEIMKEVQKKIQKLVAQEYVTTHYSFHSLPQLMERDYNANQRNASDYKLLMKESWYSVEGGRQALKIIISTDNVQKW